MSLRPINALNQFVGAYFPFKEVCFGCMRCIFNNQQKSAGRSIYPDTRLAAPEDRKNISATGMINKTGMVWRSRNKISISLRINSINFLNIKLLPQKNVQMNLCPASRAKWSSSHKYCFRKFLFIAQSSSGALQKEFFQIINFVHIAGKDNRAPVQHRHP